MGRYPYPVYGWKEFRLYENLTLPQLTELMQAITDDPASADPNHARGGLWLYTKAARKRMDAVAWAITYHLKDLKMGVTVASSQPREAS